MPKGFNGLPEKAQKACVDYMVEVLRNQPPEIPPRMERYMFDIMEAQACERRVRQSLRRLGWGS